MANKQSSPEIRGAAFSAAREKCAMSVEELAHLACLSKKQIQQIENGQSSTFYSPTVKFTAAKKVAKLIQLDEKDAFDFGPQAELPFVQAADAIQNELMSTEQEPSLELKKEAPKQEAPQADQAEPKKAKKKTASQPEAKPIRVEAFKPEPIARAHVGGREQKSTGKKWLWLLPVGALVLALVQFQPFLADQMDAMMGKAKPVEVVAVIAAPVDATPATPPAEPASATPTATPQVAPVITPSPAVAVTPSPTLAVVANPACPLPDASIENYKAPSAGKPGNMVFVKMPTAQIVCVEDGDGKVQTKTMEPGLGYSFYGKPPFKLLTSGLSSAEVFFQGFRVRPSNAASKSIMLVQAD
jgi:DNA-binding XRE family transcriptional regulator